MARSQICYNFYYNSPFISKDKLFKAYIKNNDTLIIIFLIYNIFIISFINKLYQ